MKRKGIISIIVVVLLLTVGFVSYRTVFGVKAVEVDTSEQALKIAEYANPESFITPFELNQLIEKEYDVVVIGALNPAKGDEPITGSHTFWRSDYSAKEGDYSFGGMRNTTEELEDILSDFGATAESTIVVYASNAHHDAARLWWQVKLLGHKDVRYLDGGLNAWVGADYPVGGGNPNVERSEYIAPNPSTVLLANFADVVDALSSEVVLIDTRTEGEETGTDTKKGAFGPGKIGVSDWIEWTQAVNEDTLLLPKADLEAIYGDYAGKEIITYCQSGVRSAHTLLVLTQALGYENVKNYDGSWIEWSYEYYETQNEAAVVTNGQ